MRLGATGADQKWKKIIMSRIAFIGGGNMASAIIGGLIASGTAPGDITVADPSTAQRDAMAADHGVQTASDGVVACRAADTIVLAVKPQIIPAVAQNLVAELDLQRKLLISIAAGINLATLEELFGQIAIVRTMPNTPALLRLGATGLFANDQTTPTQLAAATRITEAFGICVPVAREDLLDAVTAVSGSGPAYFFLMIEEMIRAGVALGLAEDDARALTLQTALGATTMAAKGDFAPDELRRRVTSPNGTTHAAITSLQDIGYGALIERAMTACRDRAIELGKGQGNAPYS